MERFYSNSDRARISNISWRLPHDYLKYVKFDDFLSKYELWESLLSPSKIEEIHSDTEDVKFHKQRALQRQKLSKCCPEVKRMAAFRKKMATPSG